MKNKGLINNFYRDYKRMYELVEKDINNKFINSARIIDRTIIYLFIINNFVNENEKSILESKINSDGYIGILDIFFNYKNYIDYNLEVDQIVKLFNIDDIEPNVNLSNETFKKILKILNKYTWGISSQNGRNNITPDVLGNVFEKYINQKDTGAYYTEKDTINYINEKTILYYILKELNKNLNIVLFLKNREFNIESLEDIIKQNMNLIEVFEIIVKNMPLNKLTHVQRIINELKIADITCGTGAFLIEIVDLLYKLNFILNERMISLDNNIKKISKLKTLIKIIENNIYGVDIMEDAIEIAKFRLYLKLITESALCKERIEKKIKINLKVGNTLVGNIAGELNNKNIEQITFETINRMEDIDSYCAITLERDLLNNREIEQISLLEYINNDKNFNWYEEFPEVLYNGGFSCIVGNPPYIEYKKINNYYKVDGYNTLKCGNTYAFVTERAINLLKNNGVLGFIVPISIISTPRMLPLRNFINNKCSDIFYSNFADRPDTLFNGVHQKLTIAIANKEECCNTTIYTSGYQHWYKDEREHIFKKIKYKENILEDNGFVYKIQDDIEYSILNKIQDKNISVKSMINSEGENFSFLSMRLTFWAKCFNIERKSKEFRKYSFESKDKANVFTALMNSSLFYYFWETISDGWHITNKELDNFKFNYDLLSKEQVKKLSDLSVELELDLEKNKKYIGSKQAEYEYRHKKSKLIIDKIDFILREYYELTEEEYNFIIDYQLRYRMNDEYENYLSERHKVKGDIII
ncbi:Eco57I restriction-modification methylase domain-containing protein [Clostridium perfringens]|uniref:Eco57I restriction-modification methylase domain-containing protein n=1 Tax=Clostridium perfringens TaxID=1502 RepID=UPI002AC51511|nr:DNA methyltransferase [Clostridium perfringens]MDZ5041164.1 hypothetical protein [Clostridium perfringens]